jgi:hypothetical protein
MSKFHEIRPLHSSHRSSEVLCTQLPNYIGSNLVWQERMSLSLTYGEILEVREKGNHVIVKVSKSDHFGGRITEKLSLTRETKVVVHHTD